MWQTLFDARIDAIGSAIWIDNQPYTVVGVMPERFWFSSMDSPIWTPLDASALASDVGLEVVVRRPAGVTPDRAAEQLQRGLTEYASHLPAAERHLQLKVSGIEGTPLGRSVALVLPWLLGGSVLLTLLIACANVAILVIAQWTAREHEIAIRASLGASRGRIVRALLTESLLIATLGGVLGIGVTLALRSVMAHNAGPILRFFDLSLDPWIVVESALITLVTGASRAARDAPAARQPDADDLLVRSREAAMAPCTRGHGNRRDRRAARRRRRDGRRLSAPAHGRHRIPDQTAAVDARRE